MWRKPTTKAKIVMDVILPITRIAGNSVLLWKDSQGVATYGSGACLERLVFYSIFPRPKLEKTDGFFLSPTSQELLKDRAS